MRILGIETTCDETGIAVVRSGSEVLANVVASQAKLHAPFNGVLPELAARQHVEVCVPVLKKCLEEAATSLDDIDVIAVANAPGLMGALLVGLHFAKGLAFASNKPLVGVNHVEAHLYACMMDLMPPLPALGVVLSGGHTCLIYVKELGEYTLIGQTQDDAIGEAFDKVASLLGLPYPGGPWIEKLAQQGDPFSYPFKGGRVKNKPLDFSFSGLKTAVLYTLAGQNRKRPDPASLSEEVRANLAASFQRAALTDVVEKALGAANEFQCRSILLGGGVTQNKELKRIFEEFSPFPLFWPPKGLSLDNGAMIAGLGYHCYLIKGPSDAGLQAYPNQAICK